LYDWLICRYISPACLKTKPLGSRNDPFIRKEPEDLGSFAIGRRTGIGRAAFLEGFLK